MIDERREATVLADVPRVIVGMDGSAPSTEPAGAFEERARELIDRALTDAFGTGGPSVH